MLNIKQVGIKDVNFGENVVIIEPVNLYGFTIGDNVSIGPSVEIQKSVSIGNDCKIQSYLFICELVTIGNDCFISHGVMFINDLIKTGKPAGGKKEIWKSTCIGNNVSLGSNSTILPVTICIMLLLGQALSLQKTFSISVSMQATPQIK